MVSENTKKMKRKKEKTANLINPMVQRVYSYQNKTKRK
jgi:hypothetical protein